MWPTPPHSEQLSLLQSGKGGSSSSTTENAARNRDDIRHRSILIPPVISIGCALFVCCGRVWRRVVAGALLLSDPSRFARRSRSCRCKKRSGSWNGTNPTMEKKRNCISFWSFLNPCQLPHISIIIDIINSPLFCSLLFVQLAHRAIKCYHYSFKTFICLSILFNYFNYFSRVRMAFRKKCFNILQ